MSTALLATKLYMPAASHPLVQRPHLIGRLEEGLALGRRLTLVAAPAGFGKTTLVSTWLRSVDRPVAWLSLDEGDNDPGRFLAYLVGALQTVEPALGRAAQMTLESTPSPPPEPLLIALINDVVATSLPLVLVLDDYHLIDASPVHRALAFLLDYLPPRAHLVIATRADPPLPIARLRAEGQLTELYAADLRFGADEALAFLNEVMALSLAKEQIDALERRTEGWIAGLQLAALAVRGARSSQGPEGVSGLIERFAGSHRYVLDYLTGEVLSGQPKDVQDFLSKTAFLERLTGALCDAVTGRSDSQQVLESLEAANLFVMPLDEERRWYRYHRLFAEVLRARFRRSAGEGALAQVHTRAAGWYEAHEHVDQAFHHAAAGGDFERAARLIERNWVQMGNAGEIKTILRWLESMPQEILDTRPVLRLALAWVLWLTGQVEGVEASLDVAAKEWARREAAGVVDPGQARWRAGDVALRLQLARQRNQLEESIRLAHLTLELAAPEDPLLRSYGHLGLAHSYRELGDYERASVAYGKGISLAQPAGQWAAVNLAVFYHSRTLQVRGHLRQATQRLREALDSMAAREMDCSPACGILYVGLAGALCERGELAEAEERVLLGLDLARLGGHHEFVRNGCILLARLRLAQGDAAAALAALEEAAQITPGARAGVTLPAAELAAWRTRAWLAQGNGPAAASWAETAARRPGQDRGYTRQLEAVTLARVLVAQGNLEQAGEQLAACVQKVEETGARGWLIEIGILGARVEEAQGNRPAALMRLHRALAQAEPEGYVQVFVDEGMPLARLLAALLQAQRADPAAYPGVSPEYVRRLLERFEIAGDLEEPETAEKPSPLVEPLTEREIEVLQLMAAGLSNREIAEELFLAVGTVKAHLHNVYGKLGVKSRTEAAARARELRLI